MAQGIDWTKAKKPRADTTTPQMRALERQADRLLGVVTASPSEQAWRQEMKKRRRRKSKPERHVSRPAVTGAHNNIAPIPPDEVPW